MSKADTEDTLRHKFGPAQYSRPHNHLDKNQHKCHFYPHPRTWMQNVMPKTLFNAQCLVRV